MLGTNLPQACSLHRPAQIRAHQTVWLGSVDDELLTVNVGEAVLARTLQYELRCLVEVRSCRYTMQAGQVAEIFIGRSPAGFLSKHRPLTSGKKRLLGESTN